MIEFSEEEKRFMKEHDIDEEKLLQHDTKEHNKLENLMLDLFDEPEGEIPDDIMNKLYVDYLNKHPDIRKERLGYW